MFNSLAVSLNYLKKLYHKDLKILKFVFNFKFPQMNIGIHLENYRRGLYIKDAEMSFLKYEKHDQDLVQAKK